MPRLRNAQACLDAAARGLEWLVGRLGGETGDLAAYPLSACCKAPYLFTIGGRLEEGRRAVLWVNASLFSAEGELLAAPASQGGPLPEPAPVGEKAWLALAAHLSGRFDTSFRLARLLADQQGAATGGVYELNGHGARAGWSDVRSTAAAGLAFLTCGLLSNARAAGRFLTRAVQCQDDERAFHVRLDTAGRPITSYSAESAAGYVVTRERGRTRVSFLGLPVILLARLHLATGEAEWLEAAMDYFAVAERFGEQACTGEESGPLCWGAAALYGITRRRVYYEAAERIAQAWVQRQKRDGRWVPRHAKFVDADVLSLTAEAAISLMESVREAQ